MTVPRECRCTDSSQLFPRQLSETRSTQPLQWGKFCWNSWGGGGLRGGGGGGGREGVAGGGGGEEAVVGGA